MLGPLSIVAQKEDQPQLRSMKGPPQPASNPLVTLAILFVVWKVFILAVAITSPGTGYDASTLQLFTINQINASKPFPPNPTFITHPWSHIALKLSRWDAIYFLSVAHRGYLWEQEWAFGWGWTKLIGLVSSPFASANDAGLVPEAITGIILAHLSHLGSVFILYHLALRLVPPSTADKQRIAFVAAALHIIAPAGVFLSAPVGEAPTSFLTFAGILLYTYAHPAATVISGILFGLAATVRSNALLNGLLFLGDVLLRHLPELFTPSLRTSHQTTTTTTTTTTLTHLCASIAAGSALAIGFIIPQAIAWTSLCAPVPPAERNAWCHAIPPSIYTYVQRRYWDVGFLRYWTLSNAPLFALAAPMITVLVWSALDTLRAPLPRGTAASADTTRRAQHRRAIAVPQLLLAVLATTNFHVQIITRIASSCPLPYVWLARKIVTGPASLAGRAQRRAGSVGGADERHAADTLIAVPGRTAKVRFSQIAVRFMVIYATVQAGLFASFLPPA